MPGFPPGQTVFDYGPQGSPGGRGAEWMKILAIGAHYDDCIFGIPGTLLRAAASGHQVVLLSVIGDYRNWSPVGEERQNELVEGTRRLCRNRQMDMRFLPYRSMEFAVDESTKKAVAEIVADVEPEVGFMLWPDDSHPDHEVVSQLSKVAFNWAGTVLGNSSRVRRPRKLYYYDNGPRHTVGFEPDTFVDISEYWSEAVDWLGSLMSLVLGSESKGVSGPLDAKQVLSAYRGKSCGVRYAEALRSFQAYPVELFQEQSSTP